MEREVIAKILKKEAGYIAELSTAELSQAWSPDVVLPLSGGLPTANSSPVSDGGGEGPRNWGELQAMARDGYVRLGHIIALAVLVDEPGLVADDLDWLARMFGARQISFGTENWLGPLLDHYVIACGKVLSEDQTSVVKDTIDKALALTTGARHTSSNPLTTGDH